VPILFFNGDREQSDIIMVDVVRHYLGDGEKHSEWGFIWEQRDETMGQPKAPLLTSWERLPDLQIPSGHDSTRFAHVAATQEHFGERYYVASLVLTGFTIMTFLRGFESLLVDLYENPDQVERLADVVFGFEEDVIRKLPAHGFQAVAFFDDWGTQRNLIVSPKLWRKVFKPRYERQFALAHSLGLDVYFHCCGYYYAIIRDFVEIGVDLLNISQPNLYDVELLGREFGGEICFVCPVSYRTTAISGGREDIYREAGRLIDSLGRFDGGFVAYVEEYHSIGMPDENYRHCIRAFQELGRYEVSRS
jgi:hypothetical protein